MMLKSHAIQTISNCLQLSQQNTTMTQHRSELSSQEMTTTWPVQLIVSEVMLWARLLSWFSLVSKKTKEQCPWQFGSDYNCLSFTNWCGTRPLVTIWLPHTGTAIQLSDFRPSAGTFVAHSHSRTTEMMRDQSRAIQPFGFLMSSQIISGDVVSYTVHWTYNVPSNLCEEML